MSGKEFGNERARLAKLDRKNKKEELDNSIEDANTRLNNAKTRIARAKERLDNDKNELSEKNIMSVKARLKKQNKY